MRLKWNPKAREDRLQHIAHIRKQNPLAALDNDKSIQECTNKLLSDNIIYKSGRVPGTNEIVVSKSYIMVYWKNGETTEILRVLHTAQNWP